MDKRTIYKSIINNPLAINYVMYTINKLGILLSSSVSYMPHHWKTKSVVYLTVIRLSLDDNN